MSKINKLDELELYVFMLEDEYQKIFTDYKELVIALKKEFNIDTDVEQIAKLYEPNLVEEQEDLKLILKNAGIEEWRM